MVNSFCRRSNFSTKCRNLISESGHKTEGTGHFSRVIETTLDSLSMTQYNSLSMTQMMNFSSLLRNQKINELMNISNNNT